MKITPNHTHLTMQNNFGETIFADRISDSKWNLKKTEEDRKDGIPQELLQEYIDKGQLVVISAKVTDSISIQIDIDGVMEEIEARVAAAVAEGERKLAAAFKSAGYAAAITAEAVSRAAADDALTQKIDSLHQTVAILTAGFHAETSAVDQRAHLIVREGEITGMRIEVPAGEPIPMRRAGPEGIPLDLIERCQEITVQAAEGKHPLYFRRAKPADPFAWAHVPLPEDTLPFAQAGEEYVAQMAANRNFTVKQFPQREFYDHLSVRYADLCEQVSQSSQSVSALERDLGAARDLYSKQCDAREALYSRMIALRQ